MNKRIKIITTAIALALVVAAMVVGIYAATSASAGITASINWTAEQGVEFALDAWTLQSAEHYDKNSKSFPAISSHKIDSLVVDSATTNQAASGMTASLNANFIDITDDGVNNPLELYYVYQIKVIGDTYLELKVEEDIPQSTGVIDVQYGKTDNRVQVGAGLSEIGIENFSKGSIVEMDQTGTFLLLLKLVIKNPDVSVAGFNANISFDIGMGTPHGWVPLE